MTQYSYGISSTSTTTNVESLTVPLPPPRSAYVEFTREFDKADGQVGGDGYPATTWHFDALTQAQVTQLRSFCSGKSAVCYVVTRIPAGTFSKFSAIMIWPSDLMSKRIGGRYLDVSIQFRRLVSA